MSKKELTVEEIEEDNELARQMAETQAMLDYIIGF